MSPNVLTNLANLLPTGSYLAFQTLAPLFTNNGECGNTEKIMTGMLLLVFIFICWVLSFTDSITTDSGKVYYGIVTCKGLFNPHFASSASNIPDVDGYFYTGGSDPNQFILTNFDLINGVLVVITFSSLSMLTSPITNCFYPRIPATITKCAPILVALVVGMYFAFAPPARHGVGFAIIAGRTELVKELLVPATRSKSLAKSSLLSKGGDSKEHSSNSSPSPRRSPSPRLVRVGAAAAAAAIRAPV